MSATITRKKLSHAGALLLLNAAVARAAEMGVPQCISIVDDGCNLLAYVRMDGAKVLSLESSQHKAMTAASDAKPTGDNEEGLSTRLALASGGRKTNLKGGLPIIIDGEVVGGIGVGSGTGDQDRMVANAALAALPGAKTFTFS